MTLTTDMRNVLLESQYALDHLIWLHRSENDRTPSNNVSAEQVCLAEFAARTVAIVRDILDTDSKRRGPGLAFRPPSAEDGWNRRNTLLTRRQVHSAEASTPRASSPSEAPPDPFASDEDDGVLRPDAVSPSRMPLRKRKP
jgi:hypothetical protein